LKRTDKLAEELNDDVIWQLIQRYVIYLGH
jgi:hypothetical protein